MMEFALLDFVSQCPLRLEAASCGHPRGLTDGVYLLYFHFFIHKLQRLSESLHHSTCSGPRRTSRGDPDLQSRQCILQTAVAGEGCAGRRS